MSATIDDVAKKAAVSTATVSRALRGLPNVAETTRVHVLKVAKELNYVMQMQSARALNGSKVIAIIKPLIDQWFYSKISTLAELELRAAGYHVVNYAVDSSEEQSDLIVELLGHKLADAFITVSFPINENALEYIEMHQAPVVTLETKSGSLPRVYIDNTAAAELAVRYLINLGHTRIGFIYGSTHITRYEYVSASRHKGYKQALQSANIREDIDLEVLGSDVYKGGARAVKQLMSIKNPPTAIFAMTDEMAIGALKMLNDMNLKLPKHMSVIGFDDNDVSEYFGLTTIKQPVTRYGELSAEILISKLTEVNPEVKDIKLDFELVIRSSTGPKL